MDLTQKKVLVTGGAGFLGSYIVEKLRARGCDKIIIPRSAEFNLCDEGDVCELMGCTRPHVVIHCAARVGGIGANEAQPGRFFYDNAMMGLLMMEQSRRYGVEKFVTVGTVCAYPKHCPAPFKESDLWNGYPEETNAPYALAKKMMLVQGQAYREQYGMNAIYLLPANLYGPRDNFDPDTSHVIPALIRRFIEAREAKAGSVTLWGTGRATRQFLYAEDAAEGILLATERYNAADPVNLGAQEEISIFNLACRVANLCGFCGNILWNPSRPSGQPSRSLDITRANAFGFDPKMNFSVGLMKTISWYEGVWAAKAEVRV